MEKYLDVLKKSKLFADMSSDELISSLGCLRATAKDFSKNDVVIGEGEFVESVGVILLGELQTQKIDYDGNANIISRLFPADVIAASVCYSKDRRLPFDVIAASDCRVLFLTSAGLIRPCNSACTFHARLIQNMLSIIADRNLLLAAKIDILTRRTIKEKVLAYLHNQSRRARFSAPLGRAGKSNSLPDGLSTGCNPQHIMHNTHDRHGIESKTGKHSKSDEQNVGQTFEHNSDGDSKTEGWFSIPLSRRQMADYLSINRSALSRQLCILRDEGLLEFEGSSFRLIREAL